MYGWKIPEGTITHNWTGLRDAVQDHISALNWGYRVQLREKQVCYLYLVSTLFHCPFIIEEQNT